jgi:hypothetical protein
VGQIDVALSETQKREKRTAELPDEYIFRKLGRPWLWAKTLFVRFFEIIRSQLRHSEGFGSNDAGSISAAILRGPQKRPASSPPRPAHPCVGKVLLADSFACIVFDE